MEGKVAKGWVGWMVVRILLLHLDGKLPNMALMRLSAHHRALGDDVTLCRGDIDILPQDPASDRVYASLIFERTRPTVEQVRAHYPHAIIGGTGWNLSATLEAIGVTTKTLDYTIYPAFHQSLGFTQRGCRFRCPFCVVPNKEGTVRQDQTIWEIWRGDPWPRELLLLDNDFFGQPDWRSRIHEIHDGNFKVSLNQGINVRDLTDEMAEAIASVNYRDDSMKTRRIYTAWDNTHDETRVFAGLRRLVKYGVKPDHLMVYILIGFWPNETHADRDYRRRRLREFGARPYPMTYVRTRELVGFQRWVIGAYDKRVPWPEWEVAHYRPERLRLAA